jgi:hypothetical protein
MKNFWNAFNEKDFKSAQKALVALSETEQENILSQIFQQKGAVKKPYSISILRRKLHEGKTFEDFHAAWFPPKDKIKTEIIGGETYQQLFPVPIRVINAVNAFDSTDILSIGIGWLTEEEGQYFKDMYSQMKADDTNTRRHDSISTVADKISDDLFIVQSDDNLGTPF